MNDTPRTDTAEMRLVHYSHSEKFVGMVSKSDMSDLERELNAAKVEQYIPGQWVCHTCGFELTKSVMTPTGVCVNPSEDWEQCPNDGERMERLKWKHHAGGCQKSMSNWCDRAVKAEEQLSAANAEIERLTKNSRNLSQVIYDDCTADTEIREMVSTLGIDVDGDTFYVPPTVALVGEGIAKLTKERDTKNDLIRRMREELQVMDKAILSSPRPMIPDHACVECAPTSDILIAGFRCHHHTALARRDTLQGDTKGDLIRRMREMLEDCQSVDTSGGEYPPKCACCGAHITSCCKSDCQLAAILKETENL